MKKFKGLGMLLLGLLSVIAVSACTSVTVHDVEGCADLGQYGAQCAHTYITKRRVISKANWDQERIGWFCMNPIDFTDTFDSIDELCQNNPGACDYQTQEKISRAKANFLPVEKNALRAYRASH